MKKTKRLVAILLAAFMVISAFSTLALCFAAAPDGNHEELNGRGFIDYQPIPLLVIKVSFEVDGDGKDCYEIFDEATGERKLAFNRRYMSSSSPQAGEQYCYSPDSYWANLCFGNERGSLNDYYKYISNGRFYWIPAEETSGTANDGVISVTVNAKHPGLTGTDGLSDGGERRLAVEAADQFVDFSKYDADGNGDLDFTELSIVFIYGGNEISYNVKESIQYPYNTHAHVSSAIFGGLTCDGVGVWSKGAQRYVRMGEYGGNGWSQMGKLAHELGHVLNAKDLYTNSATEKWVGGCGNLSLMGSGSGGKNAGFSSPTVLDPYYKVLYGFADEEVASSTKTDYTLYSHESTKGEFNVIRVNTLNPREYYLIENRSHASNGYDNNGLTGNMQGILIWHIDERIVNGYSRPNNGGEGHAAGFTIISPTNNVQDVDANSTWSSISASNVFVANNTAQYKFPITYASQEKNPGTWYTAMTAEQAAQCDIKIEFLSEPGNEMQIRITGANDLPAEIQIGSADKAQEEMTVAVNINDFNGAAVTGCKIFFADNKNMTDAKEVEAQKTGVGKYAYKFTGLTPDKEYFFKTEVTTAYGVTTASGSDYTKAIPVPDTNATVTLVINSDLYKNPVTQNVTVGNKIRINFQMTKKGYKFAGWYLDKEYTKPFDIETTINSTEDFTIYAKWETPRPAAVTAAVMAAMASAMPGKDAAALMTNSAVSSQVAGAVSAQANAAYNK